MAKGTTDQYDCDDFKKNLDPIVVKGTGLAKDFYGGRIIYEQDLANQAFADVLKELQKNIQNQRTDFENKGR